MPKIRNVSSEDRIVPALGGRLVANGQIVEVPADEVWGFTQQSIWEPVDPEAQAVHDDADAARKPQPQPEPKRAKKSATAAQED